MTREAGGRVNDFLGEGGIEKGAPVLCANPALYEPIRKLAGL